MKMPYLIDEYQSLLISDESLLTLDRAVQLAWRVAGGGKFVGGHWWPFLAGPVKGSEAVASESGRRVVGVAHLLEITSSRANEPDVPAVQYSLLMDTLLVVFHQAYFTLLPRSGTRRKLLLAAFDAFSDSLPNIADRFQTKGLLHIERGEVGQAVQALNAALAATPSDQHDFMTRVQMVWSLLMEHELTGDAFECLIEVSPRIARLDYDEFRALLKETFLTAQRGKPRAKRVS